MKMGRFTPGPWRFPIHALISKLSQHQPSPRLLRLQPHPHPQGTGVPSLLPQLRRCWVDAILPMHCLGIAKPLLIPRSRHCRRVGVGPGARGAVLPAHPSQQVQTPGTGPDRDTHFMVLRASAPPKRRKQAARHALGSYGN